MKKPNQNNDEAAKKLIEETLKNPKLTISELRRDPKLAWVGERSWTELETVLKDLTPAEAASHLIRMLGAIVYDAHYLYLRLKTAELFIKNTCFKFDTSLPLLEEYVQRITEPITTLIVAGDALKEGLKDSVDE